MKFVLFLLLCFSSQVVQAQSSKPARPNILWITCEDISPFLGAYGNKVVKTPNLDQLAKEGVRYTRAYTTAGVCAPSRSAIITGMYQTSIGTQHMRTAGNPKYQPVPPYAAVIPPYVKCFPEYLRKAGYYCTNNEKQDYQFEAPVTVWDESSAAASYRNRPQGRPFFAVFNFMITHESQLFMRSDSLSVDAGMLEVPPIYPDTKTVRKDMARLFTNIERMDQQVGELLEMLKQDGLYDSTIIFFYSDHGGALPWMKREVLERGTHIPLIIRLPGGRQAGTMNTDLISAVDFAPTVLSLAGMAVPSYMQGQAFLGRQKAKESRKYVFAARDRMDTEYDRVRMVRDKRFRYVYNYFPKQPSYQNIEFRLSIPMMQELLQLKNEGKLSATQQSWFLPKPAEELYDVEKDPYERHNLATDPKYRRKLNELRKAFKTWTQNYGDMGLLPEKAMIRQMWGNSDSPPVTATPRIIAAKGGVRIFCATKGASIGYRVQKAGVAKVSQQHTVQTWDTEILRHTNRNGSLVPAPPTWMVYAGEPIRLGKNDTLHVEAMRIGYKPATTTYLHAGMVNKR